MGSGVVALLGASTQPCSAGAEQHMERDWVGFSEVWFPSQTPQPALPRAHQAGGHGRAHPSVAFQAGLPGRHGFGGASRQQIQP